MNKPLWPYIALILMMPGLLSCESNPQRSDLKTQGEASSAPKTASSVGSEQKEVMLRLHGSNTIGAQLAPALAKAFLEKQGAVSVKPAPIGHEEVNIEGHFKDGSISRQA